MALEYLTFYQDRFRGGVTGGGFALDVNSPSAGAVTGTITVNIPAGSTIRKAYLFVGRHGNPSPPVNLQLTLNGSPCPMNPSTGFPFLVGSAYCGIARLHVRDVTNIVSPTINTYTLTIPPQTLSICPKYEDFYLYITYNNPVFRFINTYVFANKLNFTLGNLSWPFSVAIPIGSSATSPVALAGMLGFTCDTNPSNDGTRVRVNGTYITPSNNVVGGPNPNAQNYPAIGCQGPHGDFTHYDGILTGFNGSSNNSSMTTCDVLSNIYSYVPNGSTSLTVEVRPILIYPNTSDCPGCPNVTNSSWAWFLSYHDNESTYECPACSFYEPINIFSTSVTLTWSSCASYVPADSLKFSLTSLNIIPFQLGETVIGATSGATGVVTAVGPNTITINTIVGTFQQFEVISGATSGAQATISNITYPAFTNLIQWRPVSSSTWIQQLVTNVSSLTITGLLPSTQYEWQVINLDTQGAQCAPSPIQYFMTL